MFNIIVEDGTWGAWDAWGNVEKCCKGAMKIRRRECEGGINCEGDNIQEEECSIRECK